MKGLLPVEPDQPATTPLREGAVVRWVKRTIQVSIEFLALDNSIAMVRDIVNKQAFNVHPDELQIA
ncbi:hypothetical protein [Microcoleus sp. FACHB-68]|uniref:hypothetical protein n=1 Tax=Microcoleus sp. FACHB-68 TaxID=2692826 RepID=UPI0016857676|nr:hypothetical protein [Microcoleus sp. FACHB-68]MBD1938599.1 hypothetical protein [Microcoleus sp. FACHB-68]